MFFEESKSHPTRMNKPNKKSSDLELVAGAGSKMKSNRSVERMRIQSVQGKKEQKWLIA